MWRFMGPPSMMATSIIGFANDMNVHTMAWQHTIGAAEANAELSWPAASCQLQWMADSVRL